MALAPDHPLAAAACRIDPELAGFIEECRHLGTSAAAIETAEKLGYDTGLQRPPSLRCRTGCCRSIVANFVLMGYGTGAIFGCPAHDQRDLDFARKYGLPVTPVVLPEGADPATFDDRRRGLSRRRPAHQFRLPRRHDASRRRRRRWRAGWSSAASPASRQAVREVNYRLRDWGISRQRYWGCPIPMIHCANCGVVPVPRADLPVKLPDDVEFDRPGQSARPASDLAQRRLPVLRRPGAARDRHHGHLRRFVLVFRPLHRAARRRRRPTGRSSTAGCPSTSISAASSTRSCTCSIRASSPAPCSKTGHVGMDEPFAGLFTQGMVVHETYRNATGEWLSPDEVAIEGEGDARRAFPRATGEPVEIGPIEKMSKSKRNTVDPSDILGELRRRHGALVHAVRLAARARRDLDRGRGRGRAPLRAARLAAGGAARRRAAAAGLPAPGHVRRGGAGAPPPRAPHDRRGRRATSSACASTARSRSSTS